MPNYSKPKHHPLIIWTPALLALMLVVGMFIGFRIKENSSVQVIQEDLISDNRILPVHGRVEELLRYIDAKYVKDLAREKLEDQAIRNLLKELDPHSTYISREELQDINEQLDGSFEGIGVEFMLLDDTIVVVTPIAGGPAEQSGILPGDRIVEVEDTLVAGTEETVKSALARLKGKKGSRVQIGVLREQEEGLQRYEIIRDEIPIKSVTAAFMLNKKTAYVKVNRFSSTTYREFMESLERMIDKEGMQHLVLDLRQNPGGYLEEATKMLNQFFKERDRLLVYMDGEQIRKTEHKTTGKGFFPIDHVAVLIDEGSASASEIVAGAIQDLDRGVIIGRRSFGKGLVQEQYRLSDGSAVRLTVAKYYTPSGRCIQKPYDSREEYELELNDRYHNGELISRDSVKVGDTTVFYTSEGRIVYGGGGIIPDIFVPMDTLWFTPELQIAQKYMPGFVFRNKSLLLPKAYAEMETFLKEYQVPSNAVEEFDRFYTKRLETEPDTTGYENIGLEILSGELRPQFEKLIKSRLAKILFGEEAMTRVWVEDDPDVEKALKALQVANPLTYK